MSMHTLSLNRIQKIFTIRSHTYPILNEQSMTFEQGVSYGIIGPSGSGKSTLLHLLAGFDVPTQGVVCYDERMLSSLGIEKTRSISFLMQTPLLIKELSVYENCHLAGVLAGLSERAITAMLDELFALCGMAHTKNWQVGQLSGGQVQRIALIRALVTQPTFLIADEPTGNLDQKTGKTIVELLLLCKKRWNMGLIIASHNHYVIEKMDLVFVLKDGILVQT